MYFSPRNSYLKEATNLSLRKLPAQLTTLQKTPEKQAKKSSSPNNPKNNNKKNWKSLTLLERWGEWNREWGREKANYLYE